MAQIRSITRKRTLWKDFELADTPWKKTRGIMFREGLDRPVLFILEKESIARAAIHSFFCPIRFDAIFLNAKREVVDVKESIGAWNPYIAPKKPAKYFIECNAGEARKLGIRIGEKLEWE
ncbi:MAG TPA: DUF192 domain-containing protein [Candidatus Norongarragalinales archaeon]|nr:DUF192 domain-containing protein [Candidatus Norongarragalinales archaeon]